MQNGCFVFIRDILLMIAIVELYKFFQINRLLFVKQLSDRFAMSNKKLSILHCMLSKIKQRVASSKSNSLLCETKHNKCNCKCDTYCIVNLSILRYFFKVH